MALMQKLYNVVKKFKDSRVYSKYAFLSTRASLVLVLLLSVFINYSEEKIILSAWAVTYIAATASIFMLRKKTFNFKWSFVLIIALDCFFVLNIFTRAGSLESYLIYAYFFLIATSSLEFGFKGSISTAVFITGFDYISTQVVSKTPFLFSPIFLRVGLSWLAALAFGLAARSISASNEKIQQLNAELDSKVTALVSASHVLGSINDFDKLILYFQETIGRIFGINEHALVLKPNQNAEQVILSCIGIDEISLSKNLFYIKDGLLTINSRFKDLGISIGATHKGTQGFYLLLVRSSCAQTILNDEDIFRTIFGQFILAIDNALLTKKAKEASLTDHLTGLYNQRYFYDRMADEINRAQRKARSLSLLIVDVDDFKKYNDLYGHLNGDKALAKVARVISESCRESDIAARYGGEEFVVILPDADKEGAIEVADRILEGIRKESFPGSENRQQVGLTVSIGISTYPKHGIEATEVIERADKALYRAKALGKDQAVVARRKRITVKQRVV